MAGKPDKPGEPEKVVADLGPPRPPDQSFQRQLDELKAELRRRDEIAMTEKTSAQRQLDELTEQLLRQGEQLDALDKTVRSLIISRPRELTGDEALEVMAREPNHRFLVVAPGRGLGLRVGDLLDPRAKFADPVRDLPQHILGGLRIAATGS
jgi:hypothetical protein